MILRKASHTYSREDRSAFCHWNTCYSMRGFKGLNPDGKEITVRDNEISILRKSNIDKLFNCHTDITLPRMKSRRYAVLYDGSRIAIIEDSRFVLEGTELLNEPLD